MKSFSEEKYRSLFKNFPVGLYVINEEAEIVTVNSQLLSIMGMDDEDDGRYEEFIDKFLSIDHRRQWLERLKAGDNCGSIRYMENQWHTSDGNAVWVAENANLLCCEDGTVLCEVSVEDITTRREAEKAFYETYIKLETANRELKSRTDWINALNSLILELPGNMDSDSVISIIMNHLARNFGYSIAMTIKFGWDGGSFILDYIDSKDEHTLDRIPVQYDYSYRLNAGMNPVLIKKHSGPVLFDAEELTGEAYGEDFNAIIDLLRQKGIRSFVMLPLFSGMEHSGQFLLGFKQRPPLSEDEKYFLSGLSDYTSMAMENIRLYKKLQKSYDSLQRAQSSMKRQERLNAMGRIASGITHDINNTLAPITLYTEALIETEQNLSDRARRFLGTIQNAVTDIENVTQRMRTFYKQEEDLSSEPIVVAEIFSELIELTRPRWETIPNRNGIVINIHSELDDNKAVIWGVRSDIRGALVNCVFNAVDAMPDGGEIRLVQEENEKFLIIKIEDSGTGMTEEQLRHCQEPFYTTKGSAGTGLGLSEVYGMLQRHDGHLDIISSPGKGTSVCLYFKKSELIRQSSMVDDDVTDLPELKILCVDDDPVILESLFEMLSFDGHEVTTAENGSLAAEAFRESMLSGKAFELVITDLGMPETDGYELASQIKKMNPEVPVILLTGWDHQALDSDDAPEYIDRVLNKPPKMKYLRKAIKAVLSELN